MSIFRYSHRVTYAECTLGDHIYYGRYLDLLEAARGEFFRELGITFLEWQQQDIIFPVIECRLRYRAPARYDDLLTIEVSVALIEGVRLTFAYRILNQAGQLILDAETAHVCMGLDDKLKRVPTKLQDLLQGYLQGKTAEV
jgi:acyl-CoA thioester hydrolase